jgi:hypothetical protein
MMNRIMEALEFRANRLGITVDELIKQTHLSLENCEGGDECLDPLQLQTYSETLAAGKTPDPEQTAHVESCEICQNDLAVSGDTP